MTKTEAAKIGVKMMTEGAHVNDVVGFLLKKGGVKSVKRKGFLSADTIRIMLHHEYKKSPMKSKSETVESLRENLFQARLKSAFIDVRMTLLKSEKETFTYDEVRTILDNVASVTA